jgi:hypothetical protein
MRPRAILVAAVVLGCTLPDPEKRAVLPAPAPSAVPTQTAQESAALPPETAAVAAPPPVVQEDLEGIPSPGPGWKPIPPEPARGYISFFFGASRRPSKDTSLRPLAAWRRGDRAEMRAYRRLDPVTGAPVPALGEPVSADGVRILAATEWPGRMLFYEMPSDGVQFFWLTWGSVVLEASDDLHAGAALRVAFRAWGPKAVEFLYIPRMKQR